MHTRRDFLKLAGMTGAAMVLSPGGSRADDPQPAPAKPADKEDESKNMLIVALLQIAAKKDDQEANLAKADDFCRQAAAAGADIALMPEMYNVGYSDFEGTSREAQKEWQAGAVARDGKFVRHFAELARQLNMAIACTYLEQWPVAPRNSVTLFDRTGKEIFTYAKVHTCDFTTREASCTPGDRFEVAELDTAKGKLQVGAMICYDREHPESARILMLKGAELILTPNACILEEMRLDQFKIRAYENAVAVAMANYPSSKTGCNGHSVAFNANGQKIVEAKQAEGVFLAEFDLDNIRRIRRRTIWGDAFRRPHRYGDLIEFHNISVFQRGDAMGEKFDPKKR